MTKSKLRIIVVLIAILLCAGLIGHRVFASTATGYVTAYAMLDQYGASGYEAIQGYAATHGYSSCPNDPATGWGWGTSIYTPQTVQYHTQDGGYTYNSHFYKYDCGNTSCSEGYYWIDLYHGRYKPSSDSWLCDNYYGYCFTGVYNNCTDAMNTGRHYWTYTYYTP